jgi:YgiT-type zinc finger domain-containing protein
MSKHVDDCSYCGGRVTQRYVQKPCWWGEQLVAMIDHVPAGVCEQCGERYYEAKVLKTIEGLLKHKKAFKTQIRIPLAEYATF